MTWVRIISIALCLLAPLVVTSETSSSAIVVTELFPNPIGSDDGEFIELYNTSDVAVDLTDWQLGDESTRRYSFGAVVIGPGEYLVVEKAASKIALNNTSDSVRLYWPDGTLVFEISYQSAQEGKSYNNIQDQWMWLSEITPGVENFFHNEPPSAVYEVATTEVRVGQTLTFDASESEDENDDELFFMWDFGDGHTGEGSTIDHTFNTIGEYQVVVTVDDGNDIDTFHEMIAVVDFDYSDEIIITELLPSCSEPDSTCEFIELYNAGNDDISLEGWQLADEKKQFRFLSDMYIEAGGHVVFDRSTTALTLNNSGDTIHLIDPRGTKINGVHYDNAQRDFSFSRAGETTHWQWTEIITPGEENEFSEPDVEHEEMEPATEDVAAAISDEMESIRTQPRAVLIADITEALLGEILTVTGDVERANSRGIYLMDEFGNIIRVYIQAKTGIEQPDLEPGQRLTVTGELDKTTAGLRLLPRTAEDIIIHPFAAADSDTGEVLGVSTEESTEQIFEVEPRQADQAVRRYLLTVAGVLIVGIGILIYIKKKKTTK